MKVLHFEVSPQGSCILNTFSMLSKVLGGCRQWLVESYFLFSLVCPGTQSIVHAGLEPGKSACLCLLLSAEIKGVRHYRASKAILLRGDITIWSLLCVSTKCQPAFGLRFYHRWRLKDQPWEFWEFGIFHVYLATHSQTKQKTLKRP
jgi:hypothetical protein